MHVNIITMNKLYFVTHTEVVIDKNVLIEKWPLSEKGIEHFNLIKNQSWVDSIKNIFCSTEQKALDGAKIISDYLKKTITPIDTIGEFDRTSTGFMPFEIFMENVKLFFASPNTSVLGWETAQHTQDRVVKALKEIMANNYEGDILIVSHGGVGALLLAYLFNEPISFKWNQPENGGGNYFVVDMDSQKVIQTWKSIGGDKFNHN